MNRKSEGLALLFGMLIVLIIFGDGMPIEGVGNLDTIFGQTFWPLMDVVYPLASITVFLLYGRSKGGLKIHPASILLFLAFLVGLLVIQFDDVFVLLNHPITLPWVYWTAARWFYFFVSTGSFLTFGWLSNKQKNVKEKASPLE